MVVFVVVIESLKISCAIFLGNVGVSMNGNVIFIDVEKI